MHTKVKFTEVIEDILEEAVNSGLVKTKNAALRLSVLELNNKYELVKF